MEVEIERMWEDSKKRMMESNSLGKLLGKSLPLRTSLAVEERATSPWSRYSPPALLMSLIA
jgi:hypothetical protein